MNATEDFAASLYELHPWIAIQTYTLYTLQVQATTSFAAAVWAERPFSVQITVNNRFSGKWAICIQFNNCNLLCKTVIQCNFVVGCAQFLTVILCLVGWCWSIGWGITLISVATELSMRIFTLMMSFSNQLAAFRQMFQTISPLFICTWSMVIRSSFHLT